MKFLSNKNLLISIVISIVFFLPTAQPIFAQDNLGVPGLVKDVNNYLNQASKEAAQQ